MIEIKQIDDKRKYFKLFLLADEQEEMIEKYIDKCTTFVLEDGEPVGEISVMEAGDGLLEIKSLAVYPEFQRAGYGGKLVEFVCERYKNQYKTVQAGTGDSPLTIPFYEKCGFVITHRVKNFFIENYDHPIIEHGKRLVDMVYLQKKL